MNNVFRRDYPVYNRNPYIFKVNRVYPNGTHCLLLPRVNSRLIRGVVLVVCVCGCDLLFLLRRRCVAFCFWDIGASASAIVVNPVYSVVLVVCLCV